MLDIAARSNKNYSKNSFLLSLTFHVSLSLVDQVKSPHCKATVGVLRAAKSRSLKHWNELVREFCYDYPLDGKV